MPSHDTFLALLLVSIFSVRSFTYERLNYTVPEPMLRLVTVWHGKPIIQTASNISILADDAHWSGLFRSSWGWSLSGRSCQTSALRWLDASSTLRITCSSTDRAKPSIQFMDIAADSPNAVIFVGGLGSYCAANFDRLLLCGESLNATALNLQFYFAGGPHVLKWQNKLDLDSNGTEAVMEKISVSSSGYAVVRLKLGVELLTVVLEQEANKVLDIRREPYTTDPMLSDNYVWFGPSTYVYANRNQSSITFVDVAKHPVRVDNIPFFTDTRLHRQRFSIGATGDIVLYDETACFQMHRFSGSSSFTAGPVVCLREYAPIISVLADRMYAYLYYAKSDSTTGLVRLDQDELHVVPSTTSASASSDAPSTSTLAGSPNKTVSMSISPITSQTPARGSSSETGISATTRDTTSDMTSSILKAQTATTTLNSTVGPSISQPSTFAPASVRKPIRYSPALLIIGVCALLSGCWYGRRRLKQHAQLVSAAYDDDEALVEDGRAAEKYGALVLKNLQQDLAVIDESLYIEATGPQWLKAKAMIASGANTSIIDAHLYKLGKRVNSFDSDDRSLLTYAATWSRIEVIQLLMQLCSEDVICTRDCKGYAPIHWTVLTGSVPALRAMVEHESKFTNLLLLETTRRQTLLHLAAQENNEHMFDVLFSLGSQRLVTRILARDEYRNETPLEIARRLQHTESTTALELQLEVMLLDSEGEKDLILKLDARWRKQLSRCSLPLLV